MGIMLGQNSTLQYFNETVVMSMGAAKYIIVLTNRDRECVYCYLLLVGGEDDAVGGLHPRSHLADQRLLADDSEVGRLLVSDLDVPSHLGVWTASMVTYYITPQTLKPFT